jgi:hypothetical protein
MEGVIGEGQEPWGRRVSVDALVTGDPLSYGHLSWQYLMFRGKDTVFLGRKAPIQSYWKEEFWVIEAGYGLTTEGKTQQWDLIYEV